MRDFFIRGMEMIINVVVVLGIIAIVIGAIATANSPYGGGALQGLAVFLGGTLSLIMMAGGIYLALGIYSNTRRTAEAVERLLAR